MNSIMERWIGGRHRELLNRTPIWNLPHLRSVLRQHEAYQNEHRSHTSPHRAAPTKPRRLRLPTSKCSELDDTTENGEVIQEYQSRMDQYHL